MRLGVLWLGLLAISAAHAQRNRNDDTEATERACGVEDCFTERDIRDFEVIDQTHVVVYTGSQRCAFYVEVRGTFCDLTFAPELYFSRVNEVSDGPSPVNDPIDSDFGNRPNVFETPSRRTLRICSNDLGIQVHGGQFTESSAETTTDRFGNPRADCRVSTVKSITDDQLVELYVKRRVIPPLPPMGTGQIEVGEQDNSQEEAEQEEGAAGERFGGPDRRR